MIQPLVEKRSSDKGRLKKVSQATAALWGLGTLPSPHAVRGTLQDFWLLKTWARVPCNSGPWFLQGPARRELPIALVSARPKPSGISWHIRIIWPEGWLDISLPLLCSPRDEEFRYVNYSSLFWKAYRYQIVELVCCKNIPSSLFQCASLCTK